MTEEELNRLEARAKMGLHVDSRDVLSLIALARVGLAVTPKEPTPEMFEAGDTVWLLDDDAADIYRAMLAVEE